MFANPLLKFKWKILWVCMNEMERASKAVTQEINLLIHSLLKSPLIGIIHSLQKKEKLYKSLCRMPKGLILYGYINNHWFILQANKGCGCLFMAVSWSIIKVNDYPVLEKHQLRSELLYEAFKWFLSKWKQKQVTTETFMQTNQNFWYEKHTVMFHL